MKKTKIWSVLLASVLLCACMLGTLLIGADAAEATVLNVTGTAGADSFASVEAALAEAESLAEAGELTAAGVKIVLSASQTATVDENGILFGQKTIWLDKAAGKKLPITITGSNSSVSIGMKAGNVACTNDYTFMDMDVAIGKQTTYFFAGSGNVVFERVTFGGYKGKFFADNFTQAAYEGWPTDYSAMKNEKGLVESSLKFGENSEYGTLSTGGSGLSKYLAAVGYDGTNNALSKITSKIADNQIEQAKADAKAVTFAPATGLSNLPDIRPVNTRAVIIFDSKPTATEIQNAKSTSATTSNKAICFDYPTTRVGISPVAEAEMKVYSGTFNRLRGDRHDTAFETFVGDTYISIYGGTVVLADHCLRGMYACNHIGSYNVYVTQLDENVKTDLVGGLQLTFEKPRITENCTLTVEGGTLADIYGGTADKKVINVIRGGTIKKFYGSRFNESGTTQVENYVTGGTFSGNFMGAYVGQAAPMNAVSITNKFSGGTFKGFVYPSSDSNDYTTLDYQTNEYLANQPELGDNDGIGPVFSGTVNGSYLKNSGKILNIVKAGTFNGHNTDGVSAFFASNSTHTGGVETVIDGGTFKNYLMVGGQLAGTAVSNTKGSLDLEGNLLPTIKTTINGGVFHGFWGAYGCVSGDVVTTVNGGDFYPYQENFNTSGYANAFAGGTRSSAATTVPNITNVINGGTFHSNFYAGSGIHAVQTSAKVFDNAVIDTYIYGGTFKLGVFGNSKHLDLGVIAGTANLTVDPSKSATPLEILGNFAVNDGDTSSVTLVGGEEAIIIGENTNIVADAVTGKAVFHQTQGWQARDYIKIPANSEYEITESPAIYGSYTADSAILVKGEAIAPSGATIRLAERLGVRILLNKEDVEAYGEVFTYTVKLADTTIATGTYADIVANNYSILFDGIGLAQFGETFTVTSTVMAELESSIVDLATLAQSAWAENAKWKAYADAIIEFHNVYNLDAENTITPDAVALVPVAAKGDAAGIASANVTLLMADAAGIRLTAVLDAAPVNAKILVNGEEVTQLVKVTDNTVTADLYFAHEYLSDTFVVTVQSDAGVHMTYTASIEALANQLANNDANENQNNATAFLVYIQKAVACK